MGLIGLACISTFFQYDVVVEFKEISTFVMKKFICEQRLANVWVYMQSLKMALPLMIGHKFHYKLMA